jgi:hypothetical protein
MAEFVDRDLHLVKKAVAIAILAIERQLGPFQSSSDQADMKALLDRLIKSDTELEYYARAARIAVTGKPDDYYEAWEALRKGDGPDCQSNRSRR